MNGKWSLALVAVGLVSVGLPGAAHGQASPTAYTSGTRYDLMGRVVGTIAPDPDGATGALKYAATRNTYDPAGRLIRVETGELPTWRTESPSDAPSTWGTTWVLSTTEITYNAQNAKLTERVKSSDGVTVSLVQYSYDGVGRLECTAVRMNVAAYGSLPASACVRGTQGSEGIDRITRNIYDAAGHLVQVRTAVGTSLEQAYATYSYSDNGKQEYVIDANGNRAELEYDGHDRLAKWSFSSLTGPPLTGPTAFNPATPATALATAGAINTADYEQYTYDANGNRLSLRKRDATTITYQYDFLSRMIRKTVPERIGLNPAHTRDIFYSYNFRGLLIGVRFDVAGGEGVGFAYDGLGRKTGEGTSFDGIGRGIGSLYDLNGNRTKVTYPDGTYFTYGYDGLNRLNLVQRATTNLLTASYNNRGLLAAVDRIQSAHDQAFAYDNVSRLQTLGFSFSSDSANVSWTFTRNPASQLATEARTNDTYAWAGQVNIDRSYTANGLNQYTAAGTTAFCYDPNGNLTRDDQYAYLYDVENRLVEMRVIAAGACPNTTTGYTGYLRAQLRYDPWGRLFEVKSYGGASVLVSTRQFLHDGDAMVLEYDGGGTILNRYVHGSNAKADDPLIWYSGSAVTEAAARHLYADPRGSIVLVRQSSGTTVALNSYDEWGVPNDPTAAGTAIRGRFRYTGQVWLDELGMYYYKARMYSPTLGRFMQTDPIGYDDQINLYAYVGNDPVNGVDPTGTQVVEGAAVGCSASGPACPVGAVAGAAVGGAVVICVALEPCRQEAAKQTITMCATNLACSVAVGVTGWILGNEGAIETDETGKVHGDLPNADDVPDSDVEDSVGALGDSIGQRQKELDAHPVGDPNGSAKERRQNRQHEQHKERIRRETELREKLKRRERG